LGEVAKVAEANRSELPLDAASWNLLPSPGSAFLVGEAQAATPAAVWRAAVEAEDRATTPCPLDDVWEDHVHGRLRAWWESVGPERVLLIARVSEGDSPLTHQDATILARVLSGDQQKLVASDLGIAPSTVSGRYVRALDRLDLTPASIPLALILAAQAWVGTTCVAGARRAFFQCHGGACMVISVPRPVTSRMHGLTSAQQEVAKWIIEGCSRFEIARRRQTSVHTVARQFHAVFDSQRVTGRFALVRSALELDCFR
jgi:DNA-binding CsgD family transcriptional regulator